MHHSSVGYWLSGYLKDLLQLQLHNNDTFMLVAFILKNHKKLVQYQTMFHNFITRRTWCRACAIFAGSFLQLIKNLSLCWFWIHVQQFWFHKKIDNKIKVFIFIWWPKMSWTLLRKYETSTKQNCFFLKVWQKKLIF